MEDNKVVEALEEFIIFTFKRIQTHGTSPEEINALTELVKVVSQMPRTIKAFD